MTGQFAIVKTREGWMGQAKEAQAVFEQSGCRDLKEFADKDPKNCGLLLQALEAMGCKIEESLKRKVLRDINEVLA